MKKYLYLLIVLSSMGFYSCEKFLEPGKFNNLYEKDILSDPSFTEGILLTAYNSLPNDYYFYYDAATDDAVTNVQGSAYSRMATGEWSSKYYPGSPWTTCFTAISYINKFLSVYKSVTYSVDVRNTAQVNATRDSLHKVRLNGEAHGLRAWYKWRLLQHYAGKDANGNLLGFPIINTLISTKDNWKLPRNTFAECVKSIMDDLDTAIANLPPTFVDISGDADWNATMGKRYENRICGNAAIVLKSRVALLAASPAFAASNAVTWAQAAEIAGPLLKDLGALLPAGKTFYTATTSKEIIWNRALVQKRTWEQNNFPPSLFGYGNTNPSQNLVDAFPGKNGYPITDTLSLYDEANPYANRDTRLSDYVIYNGTSFKSTTIKTYIDAPSDGINDLVSSTRTGYYLKKLMATGVNLNPNSSANTAHSYVLARMTELLLNYAEAANEAWGPNGDPKGYGSAKSKIGEIRARAGITGGDLYLSSINTTDSLRTLIRNERRLELCFEDFRFWDIRRWNDVATIQAPVKGVYITESGGTYTYDYQTVETRNYTPDMIYGPIPYEETLKYDIVQNKGW